MNPSQRRIAVINQKGGVGKTTTTANLGAALGLAGHPTLLIDLDPQAHLTLHLGVDPTEQELSVYDLLTDPGADVDAALHHPAENLALLGAEVDLAAAEQELSQHPQRNNLLDNQLKRLTQRFDFILIDCPPSLGLLTLNALTAANEVIVPMQAHFLALQGLSKLLETVQLIRQQLNTSLKVGGVVLAMHEKQTNLATEVVSDLQNFFEASRKLAMPWSNAVIYQPPIRRNIRLAECPSFGQTIFQYSPRCAGAIDYKALAGHVIETPPPDSTQQSGRPAPQISVNAERAVRQAQEKTA